VINSLVSARQVTIAKFQGTEVHSKINFFNDRLSLSDIFANVYSGTLKANLVIDDFGKKNLIHGDAVIEQIELLPIIRQFGTFHIGGKFSSSLKVSGSFENPHVSFLSEMQDLIIDNARIDHGRCEGQFSDNRLKISQLTLLIKSGYLEANELFYDLATKNIAGTIYVNKLSINSMLSGYSHQLNGNADGIIYIDGTLTSPSIVAPMTVKGLSAFGIKLGSGRITLALARRPLLGSTAQEDLVFSLSSNLQRHKSASIARFSMALTKKTINMDVRVNELEINTVDLAFFDQYFGLLGRVSGNFTAEGPIRSPIINTNIVIKEYGLFDPRVREEIVNIKKLHGPAILSASSKHGQLNLDLCASFLTPSINGTCSEDSSMSLSLSGYFSLDEFSFDIKSSFNYAHSEDIIFSLKNELLTFDMAANFQGKVAKKRGEPISYKIDTQITRLRASLPNIPEVSVREPIGLVVSEEGIKFSNDAVLTFSPGELIVSGSYSQAAVDLHFQGTIPLVLARLFIPLIQRAEGLASGKISLSGSKNALVVEGSIVPDPGGSLILKKWLEPIEVKEGKISFERTSKHSFITKFDQIKLAVGDGRLSLNGSFDKHYGNNLAADMSTFNLDLQGSNIIIRDRLNFIETDFKISTIQNKEGIPIAQGEVIITDGSAHRQFDLRNFVAQAHASSRSVFSKILEAINMQIALDIVVRQFRASARMLNLDIDANLRGQMIAEGPISHPKFKGSLSVSEGAIIFPSISFDLVESQIRLDEHSPRIFDPKIEIIATQELDKENYDDYIRQDSTVELSLTGDLDRLNLGLRVTRGDFSLSQLKIFLLLLSPRSSEGIKNLERGAQNAALAFSGEVFLRPLTNELQELLEGKTKTRIQLGSALEPGGVTLRLNWKLGPRVELQGSYMFLSDNARKMGGDKSTLIDNSPLGDIKLKLLLIDHRPMGPLFFESSFGSIRQDEVHYEPRGKIRLKYRVLSK
jgi:hypothetical protein